MAVFLCDAYRIARLVTSGGTPHDSVSVVLAAPSSNGLLDPTPVTSATASLQIAQDVALPPAPAPAAAHFTYPAELPAPASFPLFRFTRFCTPSFPALLPPQMDHHQVRPISFRRERGGADSSPAGSQERKASCPSGTAGSVCTTSHKVRLLFCGRERLQSPGGTKCDGRW